MSGSRLNTVELAGGTIAWREAGRGPALVLVHGIGGSSRGWEAQLDAFAAHHRVIAWDAPGYGASSPLPAAAPAVDDYAMALGALLDALGVTSADLVGHSLGAVMLARLCRRRSGLARRLAFVHPVGGAGGLGPAEREAVRRARIDDLVSLGPARFAEKRARAILGKAAPESAVAHAITVMAEVPQGGYVQACEMMCAADIMADLPHLACPALVIGGADDPVSPEATCRAVVEALPAARLLVLPGIGHFLPIEDAPLFERILAVFLAEP
jgi:pimeloyl-ACP methyl ester carboxylesterase